MRLLFLKPVLNWSSELVGWVSRRPDTITYLISLTQLPPPGRSIHGMGYGDLRITTDSCAPSSQTSRPSMDSSAGDRERGEI